MSVAVACDKLERGEPWGNPGYHASIVPEKQLNEKWVSEKYKRALSFLSKKKQRSAFDLFKKICQNSTNETNKALRVESFHCMVNLACFNECFRGDVIKCDAYMRRFIQPGDDLKKLLNFLHTQRVLLFPWWELPVQTS